LTFIIIDSHYAYIFIIDAIDYAMQHCHIAGCISFSLFSHWLVIIRAPAGGYCAAAAAAASPPATITPHIADASPVSH